MRTVIFALALALLPAMLFSGCIVDRGRFPLHLYGHQHEATVTISSEVGLTFKGCWQSNALMGVEEIEIDGNKVIRPSYGYAAGELECDESQVWVRFWPRVAAKLGGGTRKLGAGEWCFGAHNNRIALTENGVSEWLPVGRCNRRPAKEGVITAASQDVAGSWFEVVVGDRSHPGLHSEDDRLRDIVPDVNPYLPGVSIPAGSPVFVGRMRLLRDIHENLVTAHKPLCVSLLGERRIGKSSFLNQLIASLASEPDLVMARTSVQAWSDATPILFFQQLCQSIRNALSLPGTDGPADYNALRQMLIEQSRRFRFIIVVDEFDVLLHYPVFQEAFYWNLRALADDNAAHYDRATSQ